MFGKLLCVLPGYSSSVKSIGIDNLIGFVTWFKLSISVAIYQTVFWYLVIFSEEKLQEFCLCNGLGLFWNMESTCTNF